MAAPELFQFRGAFAGGTMRIEYEDKEIIVVYKEAGLPVQSGRTSAKDLVSMLKNHLAQEEQTAREPYLGIVHRLDQPVEGVLVFAKTPKAAADLSRQAAAKSDAGNSAGQGAKGNTAGQGTGAKGQKDVPAMEKIYRAVVLLSAESYPLVLEGRKREITLTDWILRDYSGNSSLVVEEGTRDAKRAQLTFRTLEVKDGRAMLEIRLHTGRHHQIRVQMAHAGMPLAGDRKYGGQDKVSGAEPGAGPLCLCAARLSFRHPQNRKRMTFTTEPSFSL